MKKNARKATRQARRTIAQAPIEPTLDPQEQKLLTEIIVRTIENLNLPALITVSVREHLKQGYDLGTPTPGAQATGQGPISAAPAAPVDQALSAHESVSRAWGNLGKTRDRWYKTTAALARVSPLGPEYNNAVVDVDSATHEMLSAAETYRLVASGIVTP